MGLIPATGTEITMGRVGQAYGLGTAGTVELGLNSDLGPQLSVPVSSSTPLSSTFGGQTTPNTY